MINLSVPSSFARWAFPTGSVTLAKGGFLATGVFDPEVELLLLNIISGIRIEFDAADMIEVNMGDYDPFDLRSIQSESCQNLSWVDVARDLPLFCKGRRYPAIDDQNFPISTDDPDVVIPFDPLLPICTPQYHRNRADQGTCIFDCIDLINGF
jgi:hypothetical protein